MKAAAIDIFLLRTDCTLNPFLTIMVLRANTPNVLVVLTSSELSLPAAKKAPKVSSIPSILTEAAENLALSKKDHGQAG